MKNRRLPEAFVPSARCYYVSPITPAADVAGPAPVVARDGLLPVGFANAAVDPQSVYPGLSVYEKGRVLEARSRWRRVEVLL